MRRFQNTGNSLLVRPNVRVSFSRSETSGGSPTFRPAGPSGTNRRARAKEPRGRVGDGVRRYRCGRFALRRLAIPSAIRVRQHDGANLVADFILVRDVRNPRREVIVTDELLPGSPRLAFLYTPVVHEVSHDAAVRVCQGEEDRISHAGVLVVPRDGADLLHVLDGDGDVCRDGEASS